MLDSGLRRNDKARWNDDVRYLLLSVVFGADETRTHDLLHAMQALSQLSYGPLNFKGTTTAGAGGAVTGVDSTLLSEDPQPRSVTGVNRLYLTHDEIQRHSGESRSPGTHFAFPRAHENQLVTRPCRAG